MQTGNLRLYADAQYTSPYAMSVFVALEEKGLPYELVTVDLGNRAHFAPDYAATSLTQRVPTLVHDDFALSESSAITEYLDETFPGTRLYPVEPRQRARARQVQAWLRSDLMPIRTERSTEVLFYGPSSEPLSSLALAAAQAVRGRRQAARAGRGKPVRRVEHCGCRSGGDAESAGAE